MIQLNKWTASNGFYNEKESFMYMQLKRKLEISTIFIDNMTCSYIWK